MSTDTIVPRENRELINEVLHVAKMMYDLKETNGWKDEGGLARMIDPCFTIPDSSKADQIKTASNNKYPMMTFMIENWGVNIKYDKKHHTFEQI